MSIASFMVKINPKSSVALHEQIETQIIYAVSSGRLDEGSAVPSHRALCGECPLSYGTAAKAIANLKRAGIVDTKPGRVAVVSKGAVKVAQKSVLGGLVAEARLLGRKAAAAEIARSVIGDALKAGFESTEGVY